MISIRKIYVLLSAAVLALSSCEKAINANSINDSYLSETTISENFNAGGFVSNPVNLNIVYFIPKDNPAVAGYNERLHDLFVNFQEFVTSEMNRNGFGGKTIGLPLDPVTNKVKIIPIYGALNQASYGYSTSEAAVILNEVSAYRATHASDFSSAHHTLIILPQRTDGGGQPFFGAGRNCFALDNPNISMAAMPTTTSAYIGGLFHELGHGLNLPHNKQKVSDYSMFGTTLMGSGNSTYGKSPTFLSFGDCAIFNTNEIFQNTPNPAQYASNSTDVTVTNAAYNSSSQAIELAGYFTSTQTVNHVLVYLDPNTGSSNTDHDALMWGQATLAGNTFNFTFPLADFHLKGDTPYNLKITLVSQTGVLNNENFNFVFQNNIPILKQTTAAFSQNCSYGGYTVNLSYGSYTKAELIAAGIQDNDISAIRLPLNGVKVRLYDNDLFTGSPLTLIKGSSCLQTKYNFNDKTSSLIVEPFGGNGTASVFKHASYGGTAVQLNVGAYTTAELVAKGILDNDISSIQVGNNMRVTLFNENYFKGGSIVLTGNSSYLSTFNDMTSSLIVEELN